MLRDITLRPIKTTFKNISDDEYFSSKYTDYISNSKLSLINPDEDGSPQKFKEGLAEHKIYSNAMELGSAVHELILQSNDFYLCEEIDKPSGKLAFIADYLLKHKLGLADINILEAAKEVDYFHGKLSREKIEEVRNKIFEYYKYCRSRSKSTECTPIYLSSYDRYRCKECVQSLITNSEVQKLLYPQDRVIFNEATLISHLIAKVGNKEIELKFKGKCDNMTVDNPSADVILNDLKTTGHEITSFTNSFAKFHYARQLALYSWFIKQMGYHAGLLRVNIIVVETNKPFKSAVFPVSLASIQAGIREASSLIKRVAFHEVYGYDIEPPKDE